MLFRMKSRKPVFSLLAITGMMSSFAQSSTNALLPALGNPCLDGAYVGITGGVEYNVVHGLYRDNLGENIQKTKKYGGVSGVVMGYLTELGATRTLVGIETNALISSVLFRKPFGSEVGMYGTSKTKRDVSASVSTIIGKLFNARTMVFLKAGGEWINYNITLEYDKALPVPDFFLDRRITIKPRLFGILLGGGLDYQVAVGLAVGMEYNYTGFIKSKRYDVDKAAINPPDYFLKTKEHKIMLRITYRV